MNKNQYAIIAMIEEELQEKTNPEYVLDLRDQVEETAFCQMNKNRLWFRCRECGKHGMVNTRQTFKLPTICSVCQGNIELLKEG